MNIAEFQQKVSEAGKPILVDFWANWCVPCRMTKPVLESLASEYAGQIQFLFINADESCEILEHFRVVGIPTLLMLQDGKIVGRVTGSQSESNYRLMVKALIEGKSAKTPLSLFDRMLRLGAGGFLVMVGISTHTWFVMALGGIIAFLGIYDRCPIWATLIRIARQKP